MKSTPEKYCKYCGKRLERKRYGKRLEDMGVFKKRKYCDRDCMRKGWINTEADNQNYSNSHSTARKVNQLFLKKTVCEICGKSGKLDVHHKDMNWQNNTPGNLMIICRSCHNKIHRPKKEVYDLWCANEGIGILRETLPKIQEIWGSLSSEAKSNLQDLWNIRPCKGLLCETLSGNEKKTSFRIRKLCR